MKQWLLNYMLVQKEWALFKKKKRLEFRESDASPGQTGVKQGKFVKFISRAIFITYKSQNINPISPTPKFTLDIIQIKVKSLSTSFSG